MRYQALVILTDGDHYLTRSTFLNEDEARAVWGEHFIRLYLEHPTKGVTVD